MKSSILAPKVALVFPPFGPQFVPSLGLAVLSAGVKKLGFACRTFYWNFHFTRALPGAKPLDRLRFYERLTKQDLSPLNEWIFARVVFPEADDDPRILDRLAKLDGSLTQRGRTSPLGRARRPAVRGETLSAIRDRSHDLIEEMVSRLEPYDIVGITSTFFQNMPALALAKMVKQTWPGKTVVLGGANCDDVMGPTLLEQFDFLDYVFSGEVDFSFPQFVKRLADGESVSDVSGIVYRDEQGQVARGPVSIPLQDMNSLPVPDYDDFVAEREASDLGQCSIPLSLALESSRGCWWGAKQHCVFCGLNANGMAFRQKKYDRFQWEVEQIANRYQPRFLFMTDNILSSGYYKEFVGWAKQRGLGVDFFYEVKANLNRSQVRGMADAGISWVQPGVESFSSSTLTLMRKGIRGIQNVAFLKYAREYGVKTMYGILGGFPGEDRDEYAKMAAQLPKLVHLEPPDGVAEVQYHRFSPMFYDPPTELRPLAAYSEIYPLPEKIIAGLAYYFEPTHPQQYPYLQEVIDAVKRWRRSFSSDACPLTWETADGDVVIRDRRPGFVAREFRLVDHAVAVFHTLDYPRKLQAIIQDLRAESAELPIVNPDNGSQEKPNGSSTDPMRGRHHHRRLDGESQQLSERRGEEHELISFTQEEFVNCPEDCLQPLVDAGVLYVEEDLYVSLPVAATHKHYQREWHHVEPSWFEKLLRFLHLQTPPKRKSTRNRPLSPAM